MKRKKLIILLLLFLITGCWNYRELNDLDIVSALGITKDGDKFHIYMQIMATKKEGSDGASSTVPILTIESTGVTIHDAYRKASLESAKELYIGHTSIVVIDEETAKKGINDLLDFLIRDPESRKQFHILITPKKDIKDVMSILTPIEKFPTDDILSTIKTASKKYGSVTPITYDELVSLVYAEGVETVIPGITVVGEKKDVDDKKNTEKSISNANIKLTGLGVFNKDKFLGYLSAEDSIAYNLIRNNIKGITISAKCDDKNYSTMELAKTKTNIEIEEKPHLKVKITLNADANLSEINCKYDLFSSKDRDKLIKIFEKRIAAMISSSIDYVQYNYQSDIFGFGRALHIKNFEKWNELKSDWNNIFKNLDYEIKAKVNFISRGSTLQTMSEAEKNAKPK